MAGEEFVVAATPDDVTRTFATWLVDRMAASEGVFRMALSGGSTPKRLFSLLAQPDWSVRLPWARLHLFWGDERYVPYESADSNFGEVDRLLLSKIPLPRGQIFPFPVGPTPEAAAAAYAQTLRHDYGASDLDQRRPLFDVNLLGLGDDGHTASLIPGQPVLSERRAWVAVVGQGRPEVRLTLTYPPLESARTVAFLVTGASKAGIFAALRAGTADVPAAHLRPLGQTIWFADSAAAGT